MQKPPNSISEKEELYDHSMVTATTRFEGVEGKQSMKG